MKACDTDQFKQHLRAVCKLPIGSYELKVECAMVVDVLGSSNQMKPIPFAQLQKCLRVAGEAALYYGKVVQIPSQRKLEHFLVVVHRLVSLHSRFTQFDARILQLARLCVTSIVGIVMCSDSNLPVVKDAAELSVRFVIPLTITIVSADRTTDFMYDYATSALSRGIKIITGAGGVAHIPGMIATLTPQPVLGVPVETRALLGIDSLLNIV